MRKFTFELEEILTYRKSLQSIAEVALGRALKAEKVIQDKIDALDARCAQIKNDTRGTKDFGEFTRAQDFYTAAKNKKIILGKDLEEAKVVSAKKRQELNEAMQKVNALEKLRETQFEEYKLEAQKEEDDTLDDLITSRQGATG